MFILIPQVRRFSNAPRVFPTFGVQQNRFFPIRTLPSYTGFNNLTLGNYQNYGVYGYGYNPYNNFGNGYNPYGNMGFGYNNFGYNPYGNYGSGYNPYSDYSYGYNNYSFTPNNIFREQYYYSGNSTLNYQYYYQQQYQQQLFLYYLQRQLLLQNQQFMRRPNLFFRANASVSNNYWAWASRSSNNNSIMPAFNPSIIGERFNPRHNQNNFESDTYAAAFNILSGQQQPNNNPNNEPPNHISVVA